MKTGLVLEGGAMRGLFSAGIMDVMLEHNLQFDGGIGVSAGASFGCNYKSRQAGRVIRYNLKMCHDWRFASWRSWLTTGDLYGAHYCYHVVPEKLDRFDYEEYKRNPMEFYAVCTDVISGQPVYHPIPDANTNSVEWFRASSSMPIVSRIVELEGYKLLDGGLSDSIPLQHFEELGFQRNIVILTRPREYQKRPNALMPLLRIIYKSYPRLLDVLANRHLMYNAQTAYVASREQAGAALVLRPPYALPVKAFERREEHLRQTYQLGRQVGQENIAAIEKFLAASKN